MKNPAVAKRYAEALFDIAQEKGLIESVEQELAGIVDSLKAHPELQSILEHPAISLAVKKQQVAELFGSRVSESVSNFLQLLFDSRRQENIESIYNEYVRLADAADGRIKAQVETAVPLTDEELTVLKQQLGVKGQQVEVTTSVNPALIGGAKVRVGDRVFDYTVANQLEHFRQTLKY